MLPEEDYRATVSGLVLDRLRRLDSGGLDYTEINSKGPKPYFCISLAKFVFICLNLSINVFICPNLFFCLDLFFNRCILIKYIFLM